MPRPGPGMPGLPMPPGMMLSGPMMGTRPMQMMPRPMPMAAAHPRPPPGRGPAPSMQSPDRQVSRCQLPASFTLVLVHPNRHSSTLFLMPTVLCAATAGKACSNTSTAAAAAKRACTVPADGRAGWYRSPQHPRCAAHASHGPPHVSRLPPASPATPAFWCASHSCEHASAFHATCLDMLSLCWEHVPMSPPVCCSPSFCHAGPLGNRQDQRAHVAGHLMPNGSAVQPPPPATNRRGPANNFNLALGMEASSSIR